MSTNANRAIDTPQGAQTHQQPTYFQTQRALLVTEIAQAMDSVLTNLNRLNRALEPILVIGNEFGSVEALWSTFEGVMGDGANSNKEEERGENERKTQEDGGEGDAEMVVE